MPETNVAAHEQEWMSDQLNEFAVWTTAISAAATVVLALVALKQTGDNKRQIEQAETQSKIAAQQAETAEASANVATKLHQEAVRSRVDQEAPRVVALFEKPKPPLLDTPPEGLTADYMRQLQSDAVYDRSKSASGVEVIFDRDRGKYLWFHGRGLLINEGNTSAQIRLESGQQFVAGRSALSRDECVELPVMVDAYPPMAVLPPGARALFEWAGGHSLGDWADAASDVDSRPPKGSLWFWIAVFDLREAGVIDTLMVHVKPDPIRTVPLEVGHWVVKDGTEFEEILFPLPARRIYMHEGNSAPDTRQMQEYHNGTA